MKNPKDRITAPSAYEIAIYWNMRAQFVDDIMEPRCFACQWYPYGLHQPRCSKKAWQRHLERAHIVAASIGGPQLPSNFLLLCQRCHREAPMSADPTIMLRWAMEHDSHVGIWFTEFASAFVPVLDELGHLAREGDGVAAVEFIRSLKLDFHFRSTHAERMQVMALMLRTYLESKRFEQATLF